MNSHQSLIFLLLTVQGINRVITVLVGNENGISFSFKTIFLFPFSSCMDMENILEDVHIVNGYYKTIFLFQMKGDYNDTLYRYQRNYITN